MSNASVSDISAILIVSERPLDLVSFYRDALGLPLVDEVHSGTDPHWGCELGGVHFAIHPETNFPDGNYGVGAIRLAFNVSDAAEMARRIESAGHALLYPPKDLGWCKMAALRDPDGNLIELTEFS